MAKWMMAAKKADFMALSKQFHISPVTARILRNRDIITNEEIQSFLYGNLENLHDPLLMKGMEETAQILLTKISCGEKIRIIGDYDVDGICSAYILLHSIALLGGEADVVIPHRIKDGYGLNEQLITAAKEDGVHTILTCDNGISAINQVTLAKEYGMTVLITDHHEVPFEEVEGKRNYLLPMADVIVDPKQPDCPYPFKQICGAVVALKLSQSMFQLLKRESNPLEELLPYAALATVCDVMELRDENRIIVKYGLLAMSTCTDPGLRALIQATGLDGKAITPYHAGYVIGPCLNATGRLDSGERALRLFAAKDQREAVTIAGELKVLNDNRKLMTQEGINQAIAIAQEPEMQKDRILVIYLPDIHESLAGIIAGRLREKYGKPTFVFTKSIEGIKGSGRSVECYSMYEEMTTCKELFTKYGGHKMAAGISMENQASIDIFRRKINENCSLTKEQLEEVIHIDVPMPLSYATKELIEDLEILEPFGVGNSKPIFATKNVTIISGVKMGKSESFGKYKITDEEGKLYQMVYFGDLNHFHDFLSMNYGVDIIEDIYHNNLQGKQIRFTLAYYPQINTFGNYSTIQIVMTNYCM